MTSRTSSSVGPGIAAVGNHQTHGRNETGQQMLRTPVRCHVCSLRLWTGFESRHRHHLLLLADNHQTFFALLPTHPSGGGLHRHHQHHHRKSQNRTPEPDSAKRSAWQIFHYGRFLFSIALHGASGVDWLAVGFGGFCRKAFCKVWFRVRLVSYVMQVSSM